MTTAACLRRVQFGYLAVRAEAEPSQQSSWPRAFEVGVVTLTLCTISLIGDGDVGGESLNGVCIGSDIDGNNGGG